MKLKVNVLDIWSSDDEEEGRIDLWKEDKGTKAHASRRAEEKEEKFESGESKKGKVEEEKKHEEGKNEKEVH